MSNETRPVVLLVDDESRVLSALQRGLRREAIELVTASDALKALERLEQGGVALVVSDHKMPGMNGVEFLGCVRRRWPETARILLSGWTSEIPQDELEAAGLFAMLPKPWDDAELRDAIRRAVGRS